MSDVLVNESRSPTSDNVNEVVNHSEGGREFHAAVIKVNDQVDWLERQQKKIQNLYAGKNTQGNTEKYL